MRTAGVMSSWPQPMYAVAMNMALLMVRCRTYLRASLHGGGRQGGRSEA